MLFRSIYADEGKSGTTLQHREAFKEMLADAEAGKIDLITGFKPAEWENALL